MDRKAFTLMEMMLVVVILGVLSGLALPRLWKTVEIQNAQNAENQLLVIKTAVLLMIDSRATPDCAPCDTAGINNRFDLNVHDQNFLYEVTCASGSSAWTIDAIRQGGTQDYTLSLDSGDPDTVTCAGDDCDFINR
ncbi:MAG TPA: prepilin-type N-terminal cleavage/methylation domain-containing protein [Candidatus Bathyarchaeia archaeon]|nr:prepilin-type N-terminal cleavage/methylation domain-containing protein [Candidatus Bathyarchaeia archaeon]